MVVNAISCLGKCSLSVALCILELGLESSDTEI